jgi:hypothetical protein
MLKVRLLLYQKAVIISFNSHTEIIAKKAKNKHTKPWCLPFIV